MLRGRGLFRPGKEPCWQQAEDEPADASEERDAAPFAWALNNPKSASISWYKNHTPRKIQAGRVQCAPPSVRAPG